MVGGMGFCRRNVWVDFSCRSQLRRGLVPYINTNRAVDLPESDRGLVAFLCMW